MPFHRHLATHDAEADTECTCSKCAVADNDPPIDPLLLTNAQKPTQTITRKRGRSADENGVGGTEIVGDASDKQDPKRAKKRESNKKKDDLFKRMQQSFSGSAGLSANAILFRLLYVQKKSLDCLDGKSMTSHRGGHCCLSFIPAAYQFWTLGELIKLTLPQHLPCTLLSEV